MWLKDIVTVPKRETRDWYNILRAAKTRGISLATVALEQGISSAGVARACHRHGITLADGRNSRWAGVAIMRRNEVPPRSRE